MFKGRKKPYTSQGIKRVKCVRCGNQARFQWNCCANRNKWVPICVRCDIYLNQVFLDILNLDPDDELITRYREKVLQ